MSVNISMQTVFSQDRLHRYTLWRDIDMLGDRGFCAFVCLNPSTADEQQDDPTVRRCIDFSKRWGFRAFVMLNIFAYRATDPSVMKAAADPIGAANDFHLKAVARRADLVVAAWGNHGDFMGRGKQVFSMIPNLYALKVTKTGNPQHPLYLPKASKPFRYTGPP